MEVVLSAAIFDLCVAKTVQDRFDFSNKEFLLSRELAVLKNSFTCSRLWLVQITVEH